MNIITSKQIKEIPSLLAMGKTQRQIAEHYGIHRSTVCVWVKKLKKAGHTIVKHKPGRKRIEL